SRRLRGKLPPPPGRMPASSPGPGYIPSKRAARVAFGAECRSARHGPRAGHFPRSVKTPKGSRELSPVLPPRWPPTMQDSVDMQATWRAVTSRIKGAIPYAVAAAVGSCIGYTACATAANLEDFQFYTIRSWATGKEAMSEIVEHPADRWIIIGLVSLFV